MGSHPSSGIVRSAVGLVVATVLLIASGATTVRSAEVVDPDVCLAERSGSTVTLSWLDEGGTHIIRRNGSWLADAGRDVSSFVDTDAPDGATYVVRTWAGGGSSDRVCTDDTSGGGGEPPPPPPPPGPGEGCWVEWSGSTATIRWIDEGGNHVVRRDDAWLATPGPGSSSYVDSPAPAGAGYVVRTWQGGGSTDRACDEGSTPPPTTTPTTTTPPTTPPPTPGDRVERVIHVSIDGLRADHVTAALMPNLTRLRQEGASTLNARTDPLRTQTLPNHHSQFTGRAIAGTDGHGVDYNTDLGRTVHEEAGGYVASVFDVVHDRGGATVLYAGKSKFDMMDRNWSANGRADTVGPDDGTDKIDEYVRTSPSVAVDLLRDALDQRSNLQYAFFHIRNPDNTGHVYDWGSSQYRWEVQESDRILGQVLDLVGSNPAWADSTAVVVVADHGGPLGQDLHSDPTEPGSYTIPFVVWGPGVTSGADLYELNGSDRRDPGGAQVGLTGMQPIRGHEVANLVLDLLGYPSVPGSTFNAAQDLDH
jgi:hypothetical protein